MGCKEVDIFVRSIADFEAQVAPAWFGGLS